MKKTRTELTVDAPAKINLFLEILGRRVDGYHEIDTVMQTVGLCDRLTVSYDPGKEGISLVCSKKHIPADEGNIAYRCAAHFLKKTGQKGEVHIHLEKRIPVAAGLGGGSADGAAVLKALNRLTGAGLSEETLCALGAELGADIPFCIKGGCARAMGIGERFSDAAPLFGVIPVIAIGGRGSSTPTAYRALDDIGYAGDRSAAEMLEALEKQNFEEVRGQMYNAFERVILPQNEEARRLKDRLSALGASAAMMSGSGASVFGLFFGAKEAKAACTRLRKEGYFAMVAPIVAGEEK